MRMINQIPEPYKDELKDQVGYGSISDSKCFSILILGLIKSMYGFRCSSSQSKFMLLGS